MLVLRAMAAGILLLVPLFLAVGGLQHLKNGLALNDAFPVPVDMSMGISLPGAAYADAVAALSRADTRDGIAELASAKADFFLGKGQDAIAKARHGLSLAPASAEGWALYAYTLASVAPEAAARALDQAFEIAPYDFFQAGPRARIAAVVWPYLDVSTGKEALRQVRILWDFPSLRAEIPSLVQTKGGAALLTKAYAENPENLRTINRWMSAWRRAHPVLQQ